MWGGVGDSTGLRQCSKLATTPWGSGPAFLSWLWFSLWFTSFVSLPLLSATHFLGRVIVKGMGIKERETFNLYFQFAICLYLPCLVLCHGNEEGACKQPVLTSPCESSVSHTERCYWGVRFPRTASHTFFLFHIIPGIGLWLPSFCPSPFNTAQTTNLLGS